MQAVAFLFFFRTDSTDSLHCYRYFRAYPFFKYFTFWFRVVDEADSCQLLSAHYRVAEKLHFSIHYIIGTVQNKTKCS